MYTKWLLAIGLVSSANLMAAGWETTGPVIRNPVITPGGDASVIRELCVLPATGHTLWIPNVATDIVNDFGDVKFVELSNGTAVMAGVGYSKSTPENQYEFFLRFDSRSGEVKNDNWYYYQGMIGEVRSSGASPYLRVNLNRRGDAFQVGYGANKKNKSYGAAGWFNYWGSKDGNGDINVKLVSCDEEIPEEPTKPEWVDYEVLAANGSSCPGGDVSVAGGSNVDKLDLEMPMISIESDKFARESCQATVNVKRPKGWKFAVKQYDAWYSVDLADGAKANITGSTYFQGSDVTSTFSTDLAGKLKKNGDIHISLSEDALVYSDCDGSRALNAKVAANLKSGWGALTLKSTQRFQLVWKACE